MTMFSQLTAYRNDGPIVGVTHAIALILLRESDYSTTSPADNKYCNSDTF